MKYGLPYKGSKSAIAEWVISVLPSAHTFIDLFAGGCAVTHAALLSGKYERFICNDISGTPYIFREAINGDFNGYATVPDREGFFVSDDVALKLLYSFGNGQSSYLWGGQYEMLKVPAERMITAPSMHERRNYYRSFMRSLSQYVHEVIDDKIGELERAHELQGLERLERLELMVSDYRNVNIPCDAVVYADPPYRNTGEHYGGFDFDAFDEWLNVVNYPVYVSEYDAPKGCVCIAERIRHGHMSAFGSEKRIEKIFVQEWYARRN